MADSTPATQPQRSFRRGIAVLLAADLLILASSVTLTAFWSDRAAWWLLKVAAVMTYQLVFLLRRREQALSGPNLEHLWGTANILTLIRGALTALLAGFLFSDLPAGLWGWLPALLYTLLACLDYLDGFWARRTGTGTRLGEMLDQEYDALGILVAVVLTVQYGHLPPVFLYVGLAKYAFDWGLAWRRRRGRPVFPLPPSALRRRLAGFQMGILAVFLWPIAGPPGTLLAELIIGVPLLLGFLRDWLFASGNLDPEDPGYLRIRELLSRLLRFWLPLLLRILLAACFAALLAEALRGAGAALPWLPALPDRPGLAPLAYACLRLLLILLLAAGRFVSTGALLLLLLEGTRVFLSSLDPMGALIASAALLLYLFGAGPRRLSLRRKSRPGAHGPGHE